MNISPDLIVLDRANFPMIWVVELDAYIHLLPVTKIQFEFYLWDAPNPGLDQTWYNEVTKENPRISPSHVSKDNYWQLFMGSLLPSEALNFADWCKAESPPAAYDLPTGPQWHIAYSAFKNDQVSDPFSAALALPNLAPRCRLILQKLRPLKADNMAERLLFLGGMMEWVKDEKKNWGLMGNPSVKFGRFGRHPDNPTPFFTTVPPEDPQGRTKAYGFRLLRRRVS